MSDDRPIVVVKYSGEALRGLKDFSKPYQKEALDHLVTEIAEAKKYARLAIVVGGGNHMRGAEIIQLTGTSKEAADKMGMLFTMANGRILADHLIQAGVETRVMTAISCPRIAEDYIEIKARHRLKEDDVLIFVAGTGRAAFSTDTGAVLNAVDIGAKKIIKATKVNNLYESDPKKNPGAKIIKRISADEFINRGLTQILDKSAVIMARENNKFIQIINGFEPPGNLAMAVQSDDVGSLITPT